MNPINFRDKNLFTEEVQIALQNIYQKGHSSQEIKEEEFNELETVFKNYYSNKLQLVDEEASVEARKALSQFKQHLIYYSHHNFKDNPYTLQLVGKLIRSDNFFFRGNPDQSPLELLWQDPEQKDTTLHTLCRNRDAKNLRIFIPKIVALLGETTDEFRKYISTMNLCGFTAFGSACFSGNLVGVTLILERIMMDLTNEHHYDFFINHISCQFDKYGYSPFHSACTHGHLEIVKFLLEKMAFNSHILLFAITKIDHSPLSLAAREGHKEIAKLLLEKVSVFYGGEDTVGFKNYLTHKNNLDASPLHLACRAGCFEIVKLLLQKAIKIYNAKDFLEFLEKKSDNGSTALNITAQSAKNAAEEKRDDYAKIKRVLMAYGANPDIANRKGFSARNYAPYDWTWRKIQFTCNEAKGEDESEISQPVAKRPKQKNPQTPQDQSAVLINLYGFMSGYLGYCSQMNQEQKPSVRQQPSGVKRTR